MAENIASVVDWFGPYIRAADGDPFKHARSAAQNDFGRGLYVAVGYKMGLQRGPRRLLYIGVGDPLHTRLNQNHHKLNSFFITSLWLGEISVAEVPGRRLKKINPHLDAVEWAIAYFLKLPFNQRKSVNPPEISCVVVNRWWATDYETEAIRPASRWADVVEFDAFRGTANLVWFGTRARVKSIQL